MNRFSLSFLVGLLCVAKGYAVGRDQQDDSRRFSAEQVHLASVDCPPCPNLAHRRPANGTLGNRSSWDNLCQWIQLDTEVTDTSTRLLQHYQDLLRRFREWLGFVVLDPYELLGQHFVDELIALEQEFQAIFQNPLAPKLFPEDYHLYHKLLVPRLWVVWKDDEGRSLSRILNAFNLSDDAADPLMIDDAVAMTYWMEFFLAVVNMNGCQASASSGNIILKPLHNV